MYSNDDYMSRRDRADDSLLNRLFGDCDDCDKRDERDTDDCCRCSSGCGEGEYDESWGLKGNPHAMVYSTLQEWHSLYDKDTALDRGTIFKELDLPFLGGSGGSSCGSCGSCGGDRNG